MGFVAAIILSKFDYRLLGRLWKLHVPLAYGLVLLTFVLGYGRSGADDINWIALPFGASIQPSEFLKISFILSFAYHLDHVQENINSPLTLLFLAVHGAIPVMLIHIQGDDGTAVVFIFIFVAMLFTAGISMKYIAAAAGAVVVAIPILWNFIMNYDQKMRILCIFFPALTRRVLNISKIRRLFQSVRDSFRALGCFQARTVILLKFKTTLSLHI